MTMEYSMYDPATQTSSDHEFRARLISYFDSSIGTVCDKLHNFTKFVSRQDLAILFGKYELFKSVLDVHGHIIECGVHLGGGFLTWAKLSAIFEPVNHTRRIVGFDVFDGFPRLSELDGEPKLDYAKVGGLATHAELDIREACELYDLNRPLGHIPRTELVVGDATETIPSYIKENPHLVVALLYLDFDLYEPTLAALKYFVPRMPKGAILVFDELNQANWPGETKAVDEVVGLRNLEIRRFSFTPQMSYAVI
jgi:hypothetical protein